MFVLLCNSSSNVTLYCDMKQVIALFFTLLLKLICLAKICQKSIAKSNFELLNYNKMSQYLPIALNYWWREGVFILICYLFFFFLFLTLKLADTIWIETFKLEFTQSGQTVFTHCLINPADAQKLNNVSLWMPLVGHQQLFNPSFCNFIFKMQHLVFLNNLVSTLYIQFIVDHYTRLSLQDTAV